MLVPAAGLIAFLVLLCFNVFEEKYDKQEFDEAHFMESEPEERLKLNQVGMEEKGAAAEAELVGQDVIVGN